MQDTRRKEELESADHHSGYGRSDFENQMFYNGINQSEQATGIVGLRNTDPRKANKN